MGKNTLLIVDDEEHVRHAIGRSLKGEGYELRFAAGGDEALAQLREKPADMILSDHTMPVMTSFSSRCARASSASTSSATREAP